MEKSTSKRRFYFILLTFTVLSMATFITSILQITKPVQAQEAPLSLVHFDTDSLASSTYGEFKAYADNLSAREHIYYESTDGLYGVGIWQSKPGIMTEDGLGYDELMYILKGSFVVKDASGSSRTYKQGEGLVLAKGWKGTFEIPEGGVNMLWSNHTAGGDDQDPQKAISLENHRLAGNDLGEYVPYEPEIGNLMARGHEYYYSQNGNFGVGIWESQPGSQTYESLGYDELMFVLEGRLVMTDSAGNSQSFGPGEAIVLPKGYSGTLTVPAGGVRKIWTSYMGGDKG